MNPLLPAEYELQIARQKTAELVRTRRRAYRSKQMRRHALAGGLRRLADWIEPALSLRIPTQRRAA